MSVIYITEDQMLRFRKIADKRPQDHKQSETFDYLLRFFEERRDGTIQFRTASELLSEKQFAPTKNNLYHSEK